MLDLPWASPEHGRERTRQPPWLHRALLPEPNPTPTAASQMLRAGQKHLGCTRTLSAPASGRCCRWRGLTDAQPPQGCLGSPTLAAWLCHPSLSLGTGMQEASGITSHQQWTCGMDRPPAAGQPPPRGANSKSHHGNGISLCKQVLATARSDAPGQRCWCPSLGTVFWP